MVGGEDSLFGLEGDPGRAISRDTVSSGEWSSEEVWGGEVGGRVGGERGGVGEREMEGERGEGGRWMEDRERSKEGGKIIWRKGGNRTCNHMQPATPSKHNTTLFMTPPPRKTNDIDAAQVAEVLVAALSDGAAAGKVVEIVASPDAPPLPRERWFAAAAA